MRLTTVFPLFLLIYIAVFALAGCSKTPAEEAIRENIDQLQQAIEEKDNGEVREHLSEQFRGFGGNATRIDASNIRQYLAGIFLRYKNIRVVISNTRVAVAEYDPYRATSHSTVAVTGADGLIPDSARLYQITGTWVLEDGDWKLVEVAWE